MLTLQEIISQADVLVPNAYSPAEKAPWLNAINHDFFSTVKIPLVESFSATAGNDEYTLPSGVRSKNIDKVFVGLTKYRSLLEEDVQPAQNYWLFTDSTSKLKLNPAPYKADTGIVRYHQIAMSNFVHTNLTAKPDAPPEYHWIYVIGLCSKIAKAQDDVTKANNYASEFQNALNVAAQNYVLG